jgi:hypothetical protein
MINLCTPAIIYVIFSITQILIDTFKGLYNTALIKTIVMIMTTILLNILCDSGLGVISWIIVFIPFILMTVIVTMLLYIFGLNTTTGTINYTNGSTTTNISGVHKDSSGNIYVYDPYYNPMKNPVYYASPNVVIPTPPTSPPLEKTYSSPPPPLWISSSPAYESYRSLNI